MFLLLLSVQIKEKGKKKGVKKQSLVWKNKYIGVKICMFFHNLGNLQQGFRFFFLFSQHDYYGRNAD